MITSGLILSCPRCDGVDLSKVAGARPDPHIGQLVFRCNPCRLTWQFSAVITPVTAPTKEHMTQADIGNHRGRMCRQ